MARKSKAHAGVKVKDLKPAKNPKGGKGGDLTIPKVIDKSSP